MSPSVPDSGRSILASYYASLEGSSWPKDVLLRTQRSPLPQGLVRFVVLTGLARKPRAARTVGLAVRT